MWQMGVGVEYDLEPFRYLAFCWFKVFEQGSAIWVLAMVSRVAKAPFGS
jgi:hypothetical protein